MYIDETGLQTQMYRQYVRSKREKRVNIRISGKRHARIGLVAAQCESALLAPRTYSGTMKASVFEDWFEEELLKKLPKDHGHHHGQRGVSQKRSLVSNRKKNTRRN